MTVEPQCGTTLTLGACGDTVALGSGTSQTGFGRTGTVDWVTTPKVTGDSPITAVTGKGYFLNTTAGTITINLPAGAAGSIVSMADYAGTWQTNNVTVTPNGAEKIGSIAASAILSTEGQSVTFVYVDGTQGWLNTMDSTSNVRGVTFITATGGTPCAGATSGDYKIHTFTGTGTLCVSAISNVPANNEVSYLIVGGGGSSAGLYGGGGAGGFRESKSPVDSYTASPLEGACAVTVTASPYPVVIGGGGAAAPCGTTNGNVGNVSSAFSLTSAGGGFGSGTPSGPAAGDGGSGGGEGYEDAAGAGSGNTPPVSPPQGNDGGLGVAAGGAGGGGGGATAVGGVGTAPGGTSPTGTGGAGGAGATTCISATPTAYAGGGGAGGVCAGGAGGTGGGGVGQGGNGAGAPAQTGAANTGGGGGARAACGSGGSGVVIIRYKFQ